MKNKLVDRAMIALLIAAGIGVVPALLSQQWILVLLCSGTTTIIWFGLGYGARYDVWRRAMIKRIDEWAAK